MGLKEILDALAEPDSEKKMQQWTDAVMNFIFMTLPKGIYKHTIGAMIEDYKINHDNRCFKKLMQRKDSCSPQNKIGVREECCFYSKAFFDKRYMGYFCKESSRFPDIKNLIKKKGSGVSYCVCAEISHEINPKMHQEKL